MIRPFKDIEEFKAKTSFSVGDVIITRVVQDWTKSSDKFALKERLITGFDHYTGKVYFGLDWYSVDDLFKTYEYLKDGKWLPFGVEETSTRPAKFKTGKKYFYYDDDDYENEIFINAKYIDPKDKAVTVVFEDVAVRIVKLDSDGNEYIDCNDSEDGSIKAINEVKREE